MRFVTRAFAAVLLLSCQVPGVATTPLNANENSPGLSSEKPSEGPFVEVEGAYMVPYTQTIPGSSVEFHMVPVPGGTFKLGGSEDDENFVEDEGPQVEIKVGPMWVAKYEATWAEYKLYMSMYQLFKSLQGQGLRVLDDANKVDAVTAPTELYDPSFTFEFGDDPQYPAVTMTQYAAKQYTKWLSKLTGQQYRLPTEAEWEYACRAGTTTPYSFGEDDSEIDDYAWYYDNADDSPHPVGLKKPNPFGLYDMHGNVMEWAIDNYSDEGYAAIAGKGQAISTLEATQWADTLGNRVVRGGSFQDDPELLRSAARLGSEDEDWQQEDPNIPLSPWWFTDDPSRGLGFRIFRSYEPVDDETIKKFWDIDNEDIQFAVEMRIDEGRGVLTPIDPALAKDIEERQ